MVQVLEKSQNEILIRFLEEVKKQNLDKSKLQQKKVKLRKLKDFAKKHEENIEVNKIKNKLNARSYGINFRNY